MIERLNDLSIPRDLISKNVFADERLHKDNSFHWQIYLSIYPLEVFRKFCHNFNDVNNLIDNN